MTEDTLLYPLTENSCIISHDVRIKVKKGDYPISPSGDNWLVRLRGVRCIETDFTAPLLDVTFLSEKPGSSEVGEEVTFTIHLSDPLVSSAKELGIIKTLSKL